MKIFIAFVAAAVVAFFGGMVSSQLNALPYRILNKAEYRFFGQSLKSNIVSQQRSLIFDQSLGSIVMIGDSLTSYPEWTVLLGRPGVLNFGVPGETTGEILKRVEQTPIQGKTVFLMAGTNDIANGVAVDQASENIDKAVVHLTANKNRVYLQSTMLTRVESYNSLIDELNTAQKTICARRGCEYLNINAAVAPSGVLPEGRSIDDVHLKANAYPLWAGVILAALDRELTSK